MVTTELPNPARLPPGRRIYAIGDVHGHYDRLRDMHKAIRQDLRSHPADQPSLVHLGDYLDRGPDSAGCLSLLASGPPVPGVPTTNLMGNHERMMLTALTQKSREAVDLWLGNGGDASLESWGIPAGAPPREWPRMIPTAHLTLLHGLALAHVQAPFAFVHAGVRPGTPLAEQRQEDLLWIREDFLGWSGVMLPEDPGLVIVHGHTPAPEPVVRPNRIGLDTGTGKGGPLTCAVLDPGSLRFIQT